jgi:hypothetical protein
MFHRGRTMVAVAAFASVALLPQAWAHADATLGFSERLELRDVPHHSRHGAIIGIDRAVPFLHDVQLDDAALYRLVGREDLARKYETRARLGGVIGLAGMGALVGGIVVAFTAPEHQVCTRGMCRAEIYGPRAVVGFSMAALMPVLLVTGYLVGPTPLPPEQRIMLADEYNATVAPTPATSSSVDVQAAPVVLPSGAGLGLRGTF